MKILYIVSTLGRTGPTNQLSYIIKNLDRKIFEPYILTLSPEPVDTLKKRFEALDVNISSLNLSRIQGMLFAKQKVKEYLSNLKPDIVHTSGLRADELSISVIKDVKCLSTLRNYPFEDYPMKFGKIKGEWMAKKHLKAIKRMTLPITCSNTLQKIFADLHSIKTVPIQNGVDTTKFLNISEVEKKNIRERLQLPAEEKIFISVGSLIDRKDPQTVIESFITANMKKEILVLLGDGSKLEELREKYKEKQNIIFKGSVDNVQEYLRCADYFISASLSEGLPNTVLEALSTGLPVILSDIEQHREILSYDMNAGQLAEAGNVSSFVNSINLIRNSDYDEMKKSAINIIKNHLDAKIMSNKYQEIYKELVTS